MKEADHIYSYIVETAKRVEISSGSEKNDVFLDWKQLLDLTFLDKTKMRS